MTHNALSRSIEKVPMWAVQALAAAVLTGGITWCTWASVTSWKHEVRIGVVETKVESVKDDIKDIKDGQKDINHKLDRLIERSHR